MCLSKITNRHKKDEGIGYKAFAIAIDGNLHSECRDTHTIRPINKWLKSKSKRLYTSLTREFYRSGFHIFRTKTEAYRWNMITDSIRKVKYRKVIVSGEQMNLSVIVAKEIKILPIK